MSAVLSRPSESGQLNGIQDTDLDDAPRPLIAVLGPTGAGKSELALRIAEGFGGEIVNYDSVQVYRGIDVGSAKVPESARRGIHHHLLARELARAHEQAA